MADRRWRDDAHRPSSIVYRLSSHISLAWTPVMLALLGIVLAAAALRLYCLDCQGLWYDEVSSIDVAQRGISAILTDRFGWMRVQTPLHYLLVWLTIQPLDPTISAALVRLPSALAGLLTPLVVYGLGKELFGRAQGLIAALMVALSAVHISHSQDVRPYVFLALFTALSVYYLLVAERTGEPRWWFAFAGSTVANIFMTYHALTLAMPAIAPYLLWVLYRRVESRKLKVRKYATFNFLLSTFDSEVRAIVASLLIIALAAVPVLLDILRVPRIPPDLSLFSLQSVGDQMGRMLNRLGQVGLDREAEKWVQWAVAGVALAGVGVGLFRRRYKAVLLCLSMLLIPAVLLAVLRTTNTVFQRYVLFTMPFYFLLIANALVALWTKYRVRSTEYRVGKKRTYSVLGTRYSLLGTRYLGGAMSAAMLMLLGLGLYIYFNPEQHRQLSYLPDYRGAARYLSEKAAQGDLIILADEPPQSMQVFDFYWHEYGVESGKLKVESRPIANPYFPLSTFNFRLPARPAPTYEAIDPRLYHQPAPRRIFWVLTYQQNDPAYVTELGKLYPQEHPFASVTEFDRLLVLEENRPGDVQPALERMFQRMSAVKASVHPSQQALSTLHGAILQSRGDVAQAADAYRAAGPFYLMGDEYLTTAQGFEERGEPTQAWRESVMSLFMEPYNPKIHSLLSQLLAKDGFPNESRTEQQIAGELAR